ncbi:ankyrin repeat domain-containing protein 53 isoform X2 [Pogona vitticeps]
MKGREGLPFPEEKGWRVPPLWWSALQGWRAPLKRERGPEEGLLRAPHGGFAWPVGLHQDAGGEVQCQCGPGQFDGLEGHPPGAEQGGGGHGAGVPAVPHQERQNHNGVSPLHKAASEGRENCIQPLVDAGADVHAKDADSQEPLDLCKMWGHKATAKCLRSAIWKREKANFAQEVCRLNEIKMECEARRKEFLIRQQAELDFCNHWAYNEWLAKKGLPLPSDRILGFLGSRRQSANLWKYVGKTSLPVPVPSPTSLDLEKRPAAQVPRKPHWAWNFSTNPSSAPATCIFRPNTIRIGVDPEKVPDPDFTSFLFLYKNAFGQPEIQIDNMEKVPFVPDLPFDVLEKSLYPRARHTRLEVPEDLRPRHLLDLKHRRPPGPEHRWTDQMAVSLRQTLDPAFLGTLKTHLSSYSDPKWLSPGPALDRAQGSETSSLLSSSSRREE